MLSEKAKVELMKLAEAIVYKSKCMGCVEPESVPSLPNPVRRMDYRNAVLGTFESLCGWVKQEL